METYLPEVNNKCNELSVPISAITISWFMCLFIGHVPFQVRINFNLCHKQF